jgi:hypothetical protein
MQISRKRIAGAVGFALVFTILAYLLPRQAVSISTLLWPLASGLVIGYLAFPGLEYVWSRRPPWQPTWRRVIITIGVAGALTAGLQSLGAAVSGDDVRPISVLATFLVIGSLLYFNLGHHESRLRER